MKTLTLSALLLAAAVAVPATAVYAQDAAAGYNVETTDIGTILDDPAAKAEVIKILPMLNSPQIDQARMLTLKQLAGYTNGAITDEKLAEVQNVLSKLPAKK